MAEYFAAKLVRSQAAGQAAAQYTAAAIEPVEQVAKAHPVVDTALGRSDYKESLDSYICIILTLTESVKLRTRISCRLRTISLALHPATGCRSR